MGFYGNITNTTQTNFVFDKIYTNRYSMEQRLLDNKDDGVFIGRYVLIEYGEIDKDSSFIRAYLINNKFYLSDIEDDKTRIKYTENLTDVKNNFITKGMVIYTLTGNTYTYYECTGPITTNSIYPTFRRIDLMDLQSDPWFYNMQQDRAYPGNSRGYDSTVWVKTTVNGEIKYVNIAELNSVIPTFQMVADAPTLSPILPHFDTSSTNVYYKLHWQPAWGMRIAEAELQEDGKTVYSDYITEWTQEVYNSDGTVTKKWYNPKTQEWQTQSNNDTKIKADIYFNRAAFDAQIGVDRADIKKKNTKVSDYIGVTADGTSGNEYNKHNNTLDTEKKPDTQQIHINLPAIGNMMSEAWDIIHGTDRDNYRGNAVYDETTGDLIKTGSLEGRMKAFEEIKANQIPVKRSADGTLVGSMINNATQYSLPKDKDILDAESLSEIPEKFEGDDPWIETEVNTSELVGGTKLDEDGGIYDQAGNSGISIRHTFHGVKNSKTALDKNSGAFSNKSDSKTEKLQKEKLPTTNEDTSSDDTIKLYTPYVDATGHVVGKNIETITLPYGFKTITAENSTTIGKWSQGTGKVSSTGENVKNIVADNTKDTFNFKGGNKWIRFQTDASSGADTNNGTTADGNNTLTIAHETHDITTTALANDYNTVYTEIALSNKDYKSGKYYYKNTDGKYELDCAKTITENRKYYNRSINNNIIVQDLQFDIAGHVTHNQPHTYTLPYGYKTMVTSGLNDNAQEDLYTSITSGEDGAADTSTATATHSYSEADNAQDTISIEPHNKWIQTKLSNDKLEIAHEIHAIDTVSAGTSNQNTEANANNENNINIPDWSYDKAGHITAKKDHFYTLPFGFKTINVSNNATDSEAPTQIGVVGETADNTQDSLTFEATNKWIKMAAVGEDKENKITFGHELSGIEAKEHSSSDPDITNFGDTFNVLKFTTDKAGHITAVGEESIQIPSIAFTNDTTGNVVTNMAYSYSANDKKGTFTETRENIGTLALGTHTGTTTTTNGLDILSTDTVSGAFNKVQTHINSLNLTSTNSDLEWVTDVTQTNGKIAIARKGTDSLKLNNYSALTSVSSIGLATSDTLNNAFGKLEYRIKEEEKNRAAAIEALDVTDTVNATQYVSGVSETDGKISVSRAGTETLQLNGYGVNNTGDTTKIQTGDTINNALHKVEGRLDILQGGSTQVGSVAYQIAQIVNENENGSIDTLNEIAGWIINDTTGATKMANDIATLKGDDTVSGSVANSIKNAIEELGSAAFTDSTSYATAEQGTKADSAIQLTENYVYNRIEEKDPDTGEVIAVVEESTNIQDLTKLVYELQAEIKKLKGE